MENRPSTWTIKKFLIKKMSVDMDVPENVIEDVINHQFDSMLRAFSSVKSVEISGFGKFKIYDGRLKKLQEKLSRSINVYNKELEKEMSDKKRATLLVKIASATEDLELLTPFLKSNEDKL